MTFSRLRFLIIACAILQCCSFHPIEFNRNHCKTTHLRLHACNSQRQNVVAYLKKAAAFLTITCGIDLFAFRGIAKAQEWTDRNRLAAETWRAVDDLYIDRTFGGIDWYKLRQQVVKKSYKSDDELFKTLQEMVAKLGDKYTRYLSPVQYEALLNSAKGELIGIGVELVTADAGVGGTMVARTEDGSPAQAAGMKRGDVIVNVDGSDAQGLSPEEVASLLR